MSTSTTATPNEPAALYSAFEWVSGPDRLGPYRMLSQIRDLAAGVSLALGIVERSEMNKESGAVPIVDTPDALRLTRMSIAAMQIIEDKLDEHFDDMQDRAEALRRAAKEGGTR